MRKFQEFIQERSMDVFGPNKLVEQLRAASTYGEMMEILARSPVAKRIGSGLWGFAFYGEMRGDYVIKIGKTKRWKLQEGFFQLCQNNPNPLFPKIFEWEFKGKHSNGRSAFWCVMEKVNTKDAHDAAREFFGTNDDLELDDYFDLVAYEMIDHVNQPFPDDEKFIYGVHEMLASMPRKNAKILMDFISQLHRLKADIVDIGWTNVGIRRDHSFVIFDPIPG